MPYSYYSLHYSASCHPVDARISKLLKGEGDLQIVSRQSSLIERIMGLRNYYDDIFEEQLSALSDDDHFQPEVYTLRHKNNIHEMYNASKFQNNFE
ncbi:Plasmodium exported protein, unknown function [Plasmodium ovale wallikeri]|uniref:Uncharacterized protein n=1 Tax=Plasmodium ovale wallikeri TaxID=864142 RepID=A0A1A9ASQ4_PLAOA|nr:Plasmodium exported protein, unknown function [Plasmodium ovale wallikeri]SBT59154.1 Plasmodium exported protein, unknown function [Plasmodium ovale wallikeri]